MPNPPRRTSAVWTRSFWCTPLWIFTGGLQQPGGERPERGAREGSEGREVAQRSAMSPVQWSSWGYSTVEGGGATREIDLTNGMWRRWTRLTRGFSFEDSCEVETEEVPEPRAGTTSEW